MFCLAVCITGKVLVDFAGISSKWRLESRPASEFIQPHLSVCGGLSAFLWCSVVQKLSSFICYVDQCRNIVYSDRCRSTWKVGPAYLRIPKGLLMCCLPKWSIVRMKTPLVSSKAKNPQVLGLSWRFEALFWVFGSEYPPFWGATCRNLWRHQKFSTIALVGGRPLFTRPKGEQFHPFQRGSHL